MFKIALRLLALAVVIAIGYYLYTQGEKPSESRPFAPYRLDEISSKPLPKKVFLDGVRFYAEGICKRDSFLEIFKTDQASCLAHVDSHHANCLAEVAAVLPTELDNKEQVGQYSKQYVGCAAPK